MKPFQRRDAGAYPYYKLATWDSRSFTFRDGKQAYPSPEKARQGAVKPGKYRVSIVRGQGDRSDLEPFEV